jgi:arabinogalactan oligomer/maltooligosaccharide transport system permease protein
VVWLVSGGEPDGLTDILVSEAYRWAFARGERYGYAAAYAVLIFFVLLVYALWTGRRRGPAWSVEPEAPASAQAGHA